MYIYIRRYIVYIYPTKDGKSFYSPEGSNYSQKDSRLTHSHVFKLN